MLQKKNKKMNAKLNEIGQMLNMNSSDVARSKKTIRNIVCVCLAAGTISLVGLFIFTRLDPVGLWYVPPSIKDFSFFRGFF